MKKILLYALVSLLTTGWIARAQVPSSIELPPDLGLAVVLDFPGAGDYDLYDYGLTAEIQFRDWVSHPWGYSLSLGYGDWSVDRNASRPGANLVDFSGSLEVIPFGGSLLYKAYSGLSWDIVLDAGMRYMINDSKIKARNSSAADSGRVGVNVEDNILLSLGISADCAISPDVLWTVGAGYRTDISRGEVNTILGPARDNIMETFYLETALRMPF